MIYKHAFMKKIPVKLICVSAMSLIEIWWIQSVLFLRMMHFIWFFCCFVFQEDYVAELQEKLRKLKARIAREEVH